MGLLSNGVILLLAATSATYAITCYQCDSTDSSICAYPFYGIMSLFYPTVDCSAPQDASFLEKLGNFIPKECVKLTAIDMEGNQHVARGCMIKTGGVCSAVASAMKVFTSKEVKEISCETCSEDKCNSASKLTAISLIPIILVYLILSF